MPTNDSAETINFSFFDLTQNSSKVITYCAKPMSQTYSSDLQHSKYATNIIWQIRKTVIEETAVWKKSGLKMFQNKTLLILNVIYVKLVICLANVLHAVGKCQK